MSDEPKPALEVTIRATLNDWPIDLHVKLPAEKVASALTRLSELGYTPRYDIPPEPAAPVPAKRKRIKVEPDYDREGHPCCPVHKRKLSEGTYGLYCSAKAKDGEEANSKGYCDIRFE